MSRFVILSGYRGSLVHNLHVPREADDLFGVDDVDTFQIYAREAAYYFGLAGYRNSDDHYERKEGVEDEVGYEARKALSLLANCNPNVVEWLWLGAEHYTLVSAAGAYLLAQRATVLGRKRIHDAFGGYAASQLRHMEHGVREGYMGEKRMKVLAAYGYDTKNACACIRLLRQGRELLETGELTVSRTADREELLAIKTGQVSLAEVQALGAREFAALDAAYDHSALPEAPDRAAVERLAVSVVALALAGQS